MTEFESVREESQTLVVAKAANAAKAARKKRRAGRVGIIILAVLVVLAAIVVGGGYWLFLSDNMARGTAEVTFELSPGASTTRIANDLQDAGVIDSALKFRLRVRLANADEKLLAGTYTLRQGMPFNDIIKALRTAPPQETVRVTIPEGKTIQQTAEILANSLPFTAEEFVTLAKAGAPQYVDRYAFLADAYQGSLEGFLFPDTYEFVAHATPDDVVLTMLRRFSDVWVTLDEPSGSAAGLSKLELVTLASLVEREASIAEEFPLVSSVIHNRLDRGMLLQLCSSVQFMLPVERQNRLRLTNADIANDTPYNTYIHKGLPPGPIANPGRAALEAAFHPADTNYLYFVLTGKDGSQTFAATSAEFERAKAKSKEVFGE